MKTKTCVIGLCHSHLELSLFQNQKRLRSEKVLLRESPESVLKSRVQSFRAKEKWQSTLLVLPRTEVLQKEFALSDGSASNFRMRLETELNQSLPFPAREMAYGFRIEEGAADAEGLLFALPEKKVLENLEFLKRLGIEVDEIVSEDQVLAWWVAQKYPHSSCMVLDRFEGRILGLFLEKGKLRASRVMVLDEISFFLLESGKKPNAVYVSGDWDVEALQEIKKGFSLPIGILGDDSSLSRPAFFEAAGNWKNSDCVSLLPSEVKIQKILHKRRVLSRHVALSFLFFLAVVGVTFLIQWMWMGQERASVEKQIKEMRPVVHEIQKMTADLQSFQEAQASKKAFLELLKELHVRIPRGILLKELRLEKSFLLKGESPSHGMISEAVQILEKLNGLEQVRLSHTRLRRRLNENVFEFEIIGKGSR